MDGIHSAPSPAAVAASAPLLLVLLQLSPERAKVVRALVHPQYGLKSVDIVIIDYNIPPSLPLTKDDAFYK